MLRIYNDPAPERMKLGQALHHARTDGALMADMKRVTSEGDEF